MSEKRFTWKVEKLQHLDDEVLLVVDNENKEWKGHILNIVDLLNTMSDDIEEVEISIKLFEDDVQIKDKKISEQQATIRKLQDLCGESDSENAKLRIENKKLKALLKEKEEDERLYANEIVELRKTNEEWLQFKDLGGDY